MSRKRAQERRQSTARRRAEKHQSGFETTTIRLPEGVGFWKAEEGTHVIDIVPYVVGKGNPFADPGELHYERTFWIYRNIGLESNSYVCSHKTFKKEDYIHEYCNEQSRAKDVDPDELKALLPKERQLFLVYDHADKDKGVQLWEYSYHLFGKLLDTRVDKSDPARGWDLFYLPDEDGMHLEITVTEEVKGQFKFNQTTAIDFIPRDNPLPKEVAEHGICLDDLLIETPYEKLKNIFLGVGDVDVDAPAGDAPAANVDTKPKQQAKAKPESKPAPPPFDYQYERGDRVVYNGVEHEIIKISGDGTSFTLLNNATDEVERAVGANEIKPMESVAGNGADTEPAGVTTPTTDLEKEWDENWAND